MSGNLRGHPLSSVDSRENGDSQDDARLFCKIAHQFEGITGNPLDISYEMLHSLSWEEKVVYLKERLEMVHFFPPGTDINQLQIFTRMYREHHFIHYNPSPGAYPFPIVLFQAQEFDDSIFSDALELSREAYYGWNKFSSVPVEVYEIPGDHITMMTEPHVQVLAQRLKESIERAYSKNFKF